MVRHLRVAVGLFLLSATAVQAQDITVESAWSPPTPGLTPVAAGYMTLTNTGTTDDQLISVSARIAKRVELHKTIIDGDRASMQKQESVALPAGATVSFEPGGLHIMFMGLEKPLQEGEHYTLTLQFEQAGSIDIDVTVRAHAE